MLRRPHGWLPSSHSDRWRTQVQYLHGRGWAGPNYGWARRHRLGASGARPGQSPATERRLRVRGHISTDDRFHAAGKSRRGSNIVRPRVHIVCGGVERRMTRASWRKARRSCNRMRFECNTMVGPRPPDPASSDGARCILDRHGPPAPPGAPRRDRGTPPQPRFGPESPRRRSDAEAARSVGETRPPGPPSGSFRPGLLRAGGPAPAARRPATRRR